ncbi:MAG: hypothetical protein K1060chlam1_01027, partial [Candidatus Anoxychlamydiales bacterium]|nr:hypothetical protein [Candidatus Anoxychlamydiales bacterium]
MSSSSWPPPPSSSSSSSSWSPPPPPSSSSSSYEVGGRKRTERPDSEDYGDTDTEADTYWSDEGREKKRKVTYLPSPSSSSRFLPSACLFEGAAAAMEDDEERLEEEGSLMPSSAMVIDRAFLETMEGFRTAWMHSCGKSISGERLKQLFPGDGIRRTPKCEGCHKKAGQRSYTANLELRRVSKIFLANGVGSVALSIFNDYKALKYLREAEKHFNQNQHERVVELCDLGLSIESRDDEIKQDLIAIRRKSRALLVAVCFEEENKILRNNNIYDLIKQKKFSEVEKILKDLQRACQKSLDNEDNEDGKLRILERIGNTFSEHARVLLMQGKYPQSEKPHLDSIQAYREALSLAKTEADKLRILERIAISYNSYAGALLEQKK